MPAEDVAPSPEIAAIVRRFVTAMVAKDGPVLTALLSGSDALNYIGSDAGEFYEGQLLRDGYAEHMAAQPTFVAEAERLDAWQQGEVGWAGWVGRVRFPDVDVLLPFRISFVLRLEAGIWKIVHVHASAARESTDLVGTADVFERLMASAEARESSFGFEGTATIMFTDVANSTSLAAYVGDRRWSEAIGRHLDAVEKVVAAHDGTLVKSLGDGTMSSFASARAALHAAVAVQRQVAAAAPGDDLALQIRIGLHTGDVVRAEGDFFGSVVNKAARIAAIAEPGGVLVSETTRATAEGDPDLALEPLREVELRGLDGVHRVARLAWTPKA